jgi:NAD(P)-dependent dehydrogenase (short-subunit alcohol dehydrogenase family)
VIVHGRDKQRGQQVVEEIVAATGNDRVDLHLADLSDLHQVAALADGIAESYERLDAVVSNAGIGTTVPPGGRSESRDGYELRFAVNYLAGYLLVRRLLPLLVASAPARIVSVSSAGQQEIDFDDVMLEHDYSGVRAYCQSKLAQIMMTVDLADELAGTGVTATALHPATYMPTKIVASPMSSLEEGVEATLRLVVDPALDDVTGGYFSGTRSATPLAQAADPDARARLHDLSEQLVARALDPPGA